MYAGHNQAKTSHESAGLLVPDKNDPPAVERKAGRSGPDPESVEPTRPETSANIVDWSWPPPLNSILSMEASTVTEDSPTKDGLMMQHPGLFGIVFSPDG